MSESKISKTSLLLLFNEIIKINIELLRNKDIDLSSVNSSDNYYEDEENEKRLPFYDDEKNKENDSIEEINKNEKIDKNVKNEKKKLSEKDINNNMNENINENINNNKMNNNNNKINNNDIYSNEKNNLNSDIYTNIQNNERDHINIVSSKLKDIGKCIGLKLIERMLIYKNEFYDVKDILKFISKDIWYILFNKNSDRIQTQKKGVYIINENDIGFYLQHLLIDNETNQKNNFIHYFLILIIGIIKGILKRFKIKAYVTYELNYPQCSFQISINDE
ncbi:putative trafficking protein particle complex subunit 6A [Plasmodium gaboni]|uniref:Putative trafficking protein particle complex subunit 6A n=1 Tax=Plasmodium gaboni TaxID=647221 RepID=A0A151LRW0_9APIC|nr:putative trafficking protein particle complex subunit 6A [Plasmodium gaboni]KYO01879.1 putative trafficking protein particle complex subunit 6A [Plasmodium gaboni]